MGKSKTARARKGTKSASLKKKFKYNEFIVGSSFGYATPSFYV